ncbi:MAG: NAD(P)-dependent oxidoreductase [Oscillospiraceae bacterium]|nr:NAD(P)-dependent oxidoreductase [Oscillospiraceae bacterium]
MKNTIWITGAAGKLGTVLTEHLRKDASNKIIATDLDVDITDHNEVSKAADIYQPDIIINCASISDFSACERNEVQAYRVNTLGARNLASASRKHNARMIQMSTDDVFSGTGNQRLTEFDTPNPTTIYGKSKLAGETFVRELNPKHLIIRSSWVYGSPSLRDDYFRNVLEMGKNGTHFTADTAHISTPTSIRQLSKVISALIDENEYGIFHASCEGSCSRYEFAKSILELNGMDPSCVSGTASEIPVSTLLENMMLKMTGIYEMPDWYEEIKSYISQEVTK